MTITGILIDSKSKPKKGEELYLFPGIKVTMIFEKGILVNLKAKTDQVGNFKLVADRSFIIKYEEFTFGI